MKFQIARHWAVFALATLLFMLSQFYRVSMAVITPQLISDLSLAPRQLGTGSAVFFYAFALTQIPIVVYLDRIGARLCMTALTLVAVGGVVVFATAQSYPVLLLGRALLGVGMACNFMGALKLITQWFPPHRFATLAALTASLGAAGNLLASTPLVYLVKAVGWRWAFGISAILSLLLAVIFFATVKNSPQPFSAASASRGAPQRAGSSLNGFAQLLRMKDYWIISLGTFCRYGIFAAVQALWAGPYLLNVMGYSDVLTGNLLLLLNLGFIMGGPFFGALSDSVLKSRKAVVVPGLAGLAGVLALLAALPGDVHVVIPTLLLWSIGLFASAGTVMYPHIKEFMPPELAGTAMTGINLFTMGGAAVFLQGLGALMQWRYPAASMSRGAFSISFGVCAALLAATALLYALFARETLRRK